MGSLKNIFVAYRESPERRVALAEPPGALARYRLFGLDEFVDRGAVVRHNLERNRVPTWASLADRALNRVLYGVGGYGGDFASVLASLRTANRADVIFSSVDTVGIPLILLHRAGVVHRPIVYTSVGLPERLEQLRGARMQAHFRNALRRVSAIVVYAQSEAGRLRSWIGSDTPPVVFLPFGVDVDAFRPPAGLEPDTDVVSIGADPRRDFELLISAAVRRPDRSFRIVATADRARALGTGPANLKLETDIPLERVRDRLAGARVVALPVRDNSYSGATTVLLQAMAMAKPIVVSRTEAIASGYGLEDGSNCRLVAPGDDAGFEQALDGLLENREAAAQLGACARETVVRELSWGRYTDSLWQILCESASGRC
jgi:glycosyltransferase involved in cell wall biosynthesis